MKKTILAADIGGTSSRFAHFECEARSARSPLQSSAGLRLVKSVWLKTKSAESFPLLLAQLSETDFGLPFTEVDVATFAVAGPVERGVFCSPPLIDWDVDLSNAKAELGLNCVQLINDFVAQAYACRSPLHESADSILPGAIAEDAAVAVIGAGTGLGKAFLLRTSTGTFIAGPSEGGHATFPTETEAELKFCNFVKSKTGGSYSTGDDILSGKGLSHLHEFLTGKQLSPGDVAATFTAGSETLEWFARFYGRLCRNLALELLALGGVYVAGGVASKNPQILKHAAFGEAFRDSRVHGELLAKIPVFLMSNEENGLWGAAFCGSQLL